MRMNRNEYQWHKDVREELNRLPVVVKRGSTVTNPQTKGRLVDRVSCCIIGGYVALWFIGMLWMAN